MAARFEEDVFLRGHEQRDFQCGAEALVGPRRDDVTEGYVILSVAICGGQPEGLRPDHEFLRDRGSGSGDVAKLGEDFRDLEIRQHLLKSAEIEGFIL